MNYSGQVTQPYSFNFRQIRLLIDQAFSDSEFAVFCFDNFREKSDVARNFNLERSCRIMELIEYCDRSGQLDKLLDLIKACNPFQYDKHHPYKLEEAQPNVVSQRKQVRSPQTITIALTINLDWETWENMSNGEQDIIKSLFQFVIASETNLQRNQVNVLAASPGSVKLEIEVPLDTVIELLSRNTDYLLSEFGIENIGLLTNKKPVKIVNELTKKEKIIRDIAEALIALRLERGKSYASLISSIIKTNFEKGRVEFFLEGETNKQAKDYVDFVTMIYDDSHQTIHQIQQERSREVWDDLAKQLEVWSYHFLLRKGFHAGQETQTLAREYATESAIAILQAHFPYDTDVKAWLQQIVIYTCCNQIDDWKRQQAIKKKLHQALDAEKAGGTEIDTYWEHMILEDERSALYTAIQQLKNPNLRKVIWLRYYEGLSSSEIAQIMGTSYQYVDKMHWKAKQLLGKILTDLETGQSKTGNRAKSSQEEKNVLYQAIQMLPNPKMREILWFRHSGGLSSQETAQLIGSSHQNVEALCNKAEELWGEILVGGNLLTTDMSHLGLS